MKCTAWCAAIGLIIAQRAGRTISGAQVATMGLTVATTVLAASAVVASSWPRTVILWLPLLGLCSFVLGRLLRRHMSWSVVALTVILADASLVVV